MGLVAKNLTVEEIRRRHEKPPLVMKFLMTLLAPRPKDVRVSEEWIPRPDGSKLRIVIVAPLKPKQNVPGILRIHGGGLERRITAICHPPSLTWAASKSSAMKQ
jgi:hypothetical protein